MEIVRHHSLMERLMDVVKNSAQLQTVVLGTA